MDKNRPRHKITTSNILKTLQIDRWFVILDLALLVTAALMLFTEATKLFSHTVFFLLTFGTFFWQFRGFVWRAGFWVSVTSAIMLAAVPAGKIPPEELIEIPALIAILLVVFTITRHRTRAEEALQRSETRFRSVAQKKQG